MGGRGRVGNGSWGLCGRFPSSMGKHEYTRINHIVLFLNRNRERTPTGVAEATLRVFGHSSKTCDVKGILTPIRGLQFLRKSFARMIWSRMMFDICIPRADPITFDFAPFCVRPTSARSLPPPPHTASCSTYTKHTPPTHSLSLYCLPVGGRIVSTNRREEKKREDPAMLLRRPPLDLGRGGGGGRERVSVRSPALMRFRAPISQYPGIRRHHTLRTCIISRVGGQTKAEQFVEVRYSVTES